MTSPESSHPPVGVVPDGRDSTARPSRRRVVGSAAAFGLVSMSLPRAARAASVEGTGSTAPPALPPGQISDLAATAGYGSISLAFTAPPDNGSGITSYKVYRNVSGSDSLFATIAGATGPLVLDVLDPTASYTFSVSAVNGNGDAVSSTSVTASPGAVASGGTITYFTGDGTNGTDGVKYAVHTFVDSGGSAITGANFVLNASRDLDYLVVAGGGSGGTAGTDVGVWGAGGGGAGGVRQGSGVAHSAGTYAVNVGGRRTAPARTSPIGNNQGLNGNASSFGSVSATGGGGGGTYNYSGAAGGSGGGGGGRDSTTGGSGNSGSHSPAEGYGGGTARSGSSAGRSGGGGGGGAGAAGSNGGGATTSSTGGNGGAGVLSRITGTATYYAGGGGGGASDSNSGSSETAGSGGSGGGGGGTTSGNATSGTNGTGGGGGGAGISGVGGSGGSGIVVVRYAITKTSY